jgi:2-(1,2-epoxy-1,2-dihydrophenyl)acetyl-CoA isomerase
MTFNYLKLHRNGPIWTLTLHRPEVYNALNAGLIHEIREVAEAVQINDEVRVLVITGEGKAFCSGADLKSGVYMIEARQGQEVRTERVVKY